jgi:hypothetical protein
VLHQLNINFNRAHKCDIKGVEAVESQSMDNKRAAADGQVRSSRKRQKTQPNADQRIKNQTGNDQTNASQQDQVFRFMELPGGKKYCVYNSMFINI